MAGCSTIDTTEVQSYSCSTAFWKNCERHIKARRFRYRRSELAAGAMLGEGSSDDLRYVGWSGEWRALALHEGEVIGYSAEFKKKVRRSRNDMVKLTPLTEIWRNPCEVVPNFSFTGGKTKTYSSGRDSQMGRISSLHYRFNKDI